MLPLLPGELQDIQLEFNTTLPDTATVLRANRASNGRGGYQTTYVEHGTVPCRRYIEKPEGRPYEAKSIEQEEMVAVTTWLISVPEGSDVQVTDRLQVGESLYEIFSTRVAERSQQIGVVLACRVVE